MEQGQSNIYCEPHKHKLAHYTTNHHIGTHHATVRHIYLYDTNKSPTTVKGYVNILKSTETKRQLVPSNGTDITEAKHTHRRSGTIPGECTNPIAPRRLDTETLSTKIGR